LTVVIAFFAHAALGLGLTSGGLFFGPETALLAAEQMAWQEQLTSPVSHKTEKYQYLVHALNPYVKSSMTEVGLFLQQGPVAGGYLVSASLVSSSRPQAKMASPLGFILEVLPENILAAHPTDINVVNEVYLTNGETQQDFETRFRAKTEEQFHDRYRTKLGVRVLSPAGLLAKTEPGSYNEVVIFNPKESRLKISGVYVSREAMSSPKYQNLRNGIQKAADQFGVPIIELP